MLYVVTVALQDAGLKAQDVKEVLLVGGMTRMPKVRECGEGGLGLGGGHMGTPIRCHGLYLSLSSCR
jgi:hypothetical protein